MARRWPTPGGPLPWPPDSRDTRSLPLQPKLFLGLALFDCDLVGEARAAFREALDDEFGSGWWLSDALMADAQASFVLGEWEDAVPGLIAGGQAAQAEGQPAPGVPIARLPDHHRDGVGRYLAAAAELAAGIANSLQGDELSYNAGIPRVRGGRIEGGPGRPAGRLRPVAPDAGGSTPDGRTATTTAALLPISCGWPWRWVNVTSPPRWRASSRREFRWRRRCRRFAAWRCAARDWWTARSSR